MTQQKSLSKVAQSMPGPTEMNDEWAQNGFGPTLRTDFREVDIVEKSAEYIIGKRVSHCVLWPSLRAGFILTLLTNRPGKLGWSLPGRAGCLLIKS